MISRLANHCFWLGRYVERAESAARVLSVTLHLALDAELSPRSCWLPVLIVCGEQGPFLRRRGEAAAADGEAVQGYMTWDEDNLASIRRSVGFARDNARAVRDLISREVWETLNELHLWLGSDAARATYQEHRDGFYQQVRRATQLTLGLVRSTMLHDTPLDFIWLGVLLERASQTARLLDVHHYALRALEAHQVVETSLWLSLLRALAGFEPFMKRHQGRVSGDAVASFLIGEPRFPRSLRYCIRSAYERLCAIRPPEAAALPGEAVLRRLRALDAHLSGLGDAALPPEAVHGLLVRVIEETAAICTGVEEELLGAAPPRPGAEAAAAAPE